MLYAAQIRAEEILSRLGKNPVGVEVGVLRGALSRRLLVRPDLRLTMVDSWGEYQPGYRESIDYAAEQTDIEQHNNRESADVLTRFAEDRRTIVQDDSVRAADGLPEGTLDFVFVDADHSYDGCRRDLVAWFPKLKTGGLLCGHDYERPDLPETKWGVKEAVDEFAAEHGLTVELGGDHTWFCRLPGPLPEESDTYDNIVFACVKWGTKYGAEYVNILADMVARNCELAGRFICFTDDERGLAEDIECRILPLGYEGWWNKLWLFHPDALPARSRIVFLDLDVIVCGPLEPLVRTKGIAADWLQGGYNSSVMVWDHGEHAEAWNWLKPADMRRLHGDQDWLTELGGWNLLPTDWIVSYRLHSQEWPPEGAKVVAFHGKPKPHEISEGWVPEMWSMGGLAMPRYTSQLNNDITTIRANVTTNVANDVPGIMQGKPNDRTLIIAAGGPSLGRWLPALRLEQAMAAYRGPGADLWALNGVHDYLIDRGIIPEAMVMLDSRKACVEAFLTRPHRAVEYLIATQCDPSAFEALAGYRARKWTGWYWGVEHLDNQWIGGGATVGLKSICLGWAMGYRKFSLYGYDSSYEDGDGHAYPQPMNDADLRVDVVLKGRKFVAARWMAKQVMEFLAMAAELTKDPAVDIRINCDGLLRFAAEIAEEKPERKVA